MFLAWADVDLGDMHTALGLIQAAFADLSQGRVSGEAVERAKQKILLRLAQGYESNADFADYYADAAYELEAYGCFRDEAENIEKIGP